MSNLQVFKICISIYQEQSHRACCGLGVIQKHDTVTQPTAMQPTPDDSERKM